MLTPSDLSKEELLELLKDAAKNWLTHDGLWFLEVEKNYGIQKAIELDKSTWEKFTIIEAKRIMDRLKIKSNGGIPALIQALGFRLYAYINKQEVIKVNDNKIIFQMNDCRVQSARKRNKLPDFPCKEVGIVEYSFFAQTIDPRIKTKCIACPPDPHPEEFYCAWEFSLEE